jgi:Holliday junction resolvasome RuvABC DNA-binding subunit
LRPRERIEIRHKEIFDDALSALSNLGYSSRDAKRALEHVLRTDAEVNLEALLKEALRRLARGDSP